MSRFPLLVVGLAALACGCASEPEPAPLTAGYLEQLEEFRRGRIESLAGEEGWLGLVGLYWLEEGESRFGSDPNAEIVLPDRPALAGEPAVLGSLLVEAGRVELRPRPGSSLTIEGEPARNTTLADDSGGEPTVLELGSLRFLVIERSGRLALRVRDSESPARRDFAGLEWFPPDPRWRIEGRVDPYEPPRSLEVPSVMGWDVSQSSPGAVVFEAAGGPVRLDVLADSTDDRLFVIFGDATNGHETYDGGRYLYAEPPGEDGKVIVDFNRAYSPPCVFTPYATCPLPPPQNRLPFRVEAGEKLPPGHHAPAARE